ncbi:Holliday junction ATP-dependent DNA helicase RuvA [bioreactor metagenome]|uniref:Holliday junction ATP-dependent DNA helicase RuvA n=1 Tax=bioreactor metagenome TaxID=1076179 RepID=A0A645DJS8_9ZZZZ|nr:Holliday junction branch migration protein RuvA [Erysipelotrichaceae bacterium]
MIAFIIGKVFSYGIDNVILENNGIGYRINFTHPEVLSLHKEIMIYTYQHVREDEISLFGFVSMEEYELFLKLIGVKGLGPKTALNILGVIRSPELIKIIENNDIDALKRLPGIGAKTASQIILDLRGKLVRPDDNTVDIPDAVNDALSGLRSLGYKSSELQSLTKELLKQPGLSAEEYIKMSLQLLLARKGI